MSDVIDKQLGIQQAGGSIDLAKELFGMLLKDLPEQQEQLNQAYNERQLSALWDHAHKIHGSTAYCGVPRLQSTTQALEEAIRAENWDAIANGLALVNEAIADLLGRGTQLLEEHWP
ncbi:MAG: Hpt domain-containing protein [Pseudomonadota bacterium]|nr:MAG: Hpt domain-containing protein [Pseudomonadota bacterium]